MLIGEVSRRSGVSTRMLRHYDALGLVRPSGRASSGYREYSAADFRRLFHVECLRSLGLSLQDAKRALDDPAFEPTAVVSALIDHTRARMAEQQRVLDRLAQIEAAAPGQWEDVIDTVGLLRALESGSGSHRQQAVLAQREGGMPTEALVEAVLAEEDLNVAGALRWSLARAGDDAVPGLARGMASADAEVRRRAVVATAAIPTPPATELLLAALDDVDAGVRDRAALELGQRLVPAATDLLAAMVVAGRRDVEAAEALGKLGEATVPTEAVVAALEEALGPSDSPPARLRVAQALAEIPGASSDGALARLAADDDSTIAATAAAILADRGR
ncbi:putative MerR family transcriptional regulator [Gordonia araii NBRC 100433]|uniref:Putative MerR family transcriptional regulator n=1 Tax=Gordonia araii NBRC 100433 TaxID=1073574 RepID=G7H546_9ACTN|nr:MerR family transcriptional regulator [Gordonia araii]NNG96661.1 MerR family transcriptional regulator [Gordonia araii NBRC 100433]GAB10971.1 putative MerR family transcriptional regulator [Gordonia araii NBRC 100433]